MSRISVPRSSLERAAYGAVLLVLALSAAQAAAGADIALRSGLIRYWAMFSGAAFAVALPHLLFPDAQRPLHQLLNESPARLLRGQVRTVAPLVGGLGVPVVVLAAYDPGAFGQDLAAKSTIAARGLVTVIAAGSYGLACYLAMGPRLQAWHEGQAGRWYQTAKEETGHGLDMPPGLVPALFTTGRIVLVVVAVVIAAAYAERVALGWALVPGGIFLGASAARLGRMRRTFDRAYYSTNAFYGEVLGGGPAGAAAREPVALETLYWVPARWRPATWASLRQLDRMLPLGRFVLIGHVLLWTLVYQGVSGPLVYSYLLVLVLAQNSAGLLLSQRAAAPPAFQVTMQAPLDWAVTRFFVNLRWALSLALSLMLVAALDADFLWTDALLWTGLDVLAAALVAAGATYRTEGAVRRRYA